MSPDLIEAGFEPYGPVHALALAGSFVFVAATVLLGRRDQARPNSGRGRLGWIWFVVLLQAFTQVWMNMPERFDPAQTLPLHVCDLAPWIGAAALWFRTPGLQAVTFYWGFGLSVFAFLMPILSAGPMQLEFWLFWVGHSQILGTAAWVLVVDGFRPDGGALRLALIVTILYSAAAVGLNVVFEADYGYVGQRSTDLPLGPWPARAIVLLAGKALIFALLSAPWWIASKRRSQSPTS